jgi:hypothetical protein
MSRGVRLAALVASVLLAAGCSGDLAGEIIHEPATLGPLVGERVTWDTTGAGAVSTIYGARIHGDAVVLQAGERDDHRLAVVDAGTGRPRWSRKNFAELRGGNGATLFDPAPGGAPLVAGAPEDFVVLVHYYRDDCDQPTGCPLDGDGEPREEQGIAALSGKDGTVRWMTPLPKGGGGEDDRLRIEPLAASDDLVLVGVVDTNNDLGTLRTVALDTADGRQRWARCQSSLPRIPRSSGSRKAPTTSAWVPPVWARKVPSWR